MNIIFSVLTSLNTLNAIFSNFTGGGFTGGGIGTSISERYNDFTKYLNNSDPSALNAEFFPPNAVRIIDPIRRNSLTVQPELGARPSFQIPSTEGTLFQLVQLEPNSKNFQIKVNGTEYALTRMKKAWTVSFIDENFELQLSNKEDQNQLFNIHPLQGNEVKISYGTNHCLDSSDHSGFIKGILCLLYKDSQKFQLVPVMSQNNAAQNGITIGGSDRRSFDYTRHSHYQ